MGSVVGSGSTPLGSSWSEGPPDCVVVGDVAVVAVDEVELVGVAGSVASGVEPSLPAVEGPVVLVPDLGVGPVGCDVADRDATEVVDVDRSSTVDVGRVVAVSVRLESDSAVGDGAPVDAVAVVDAVPWLGSSPRVAAGTDDVGPRSVSLAPDGAVVPGPPVPGVPGVMLGSSPHAARSSAIMTTATSHNLSTSSLPHAPAPRSTRRLKILRRSACPPGRLPVAPFIPTALMAERP